MTMDVTKLKNDTATNCEENPVKVVKRPFDVAFLMLPDEKLKQHQKITKINNNESGDEDEEIEVGTNQDYVKTHQKYKQIFDDPNLVKAKNLDELRKAPEQKSAFTKVNLTSRLSPSLSLSPPDLTYQNSLSPSPPIRNYFLKNHTYQNTFMPEMHPSSIENPFLLKTPEPNFPKIRPIYRPDLPYNYQQFPPQEVLKMTPEIRNPAAAILTSLLPPSLAALSLPAQNVCAKCNISFRMTSDLVYHMRSHHKNDSADMSKRRREEKLKCPVCAESFRERHHLTRHMTAHQDKDEEEGAEGKKKCGVH